MEIKLTYNQGHGAYVFEPMGIKDLEEEMCDYEAWKSLPYDARAIIGRLLVSEFSDYVKIDELGLPVWKFKIIYIDDSEEIIFLRSNYRNLHVDFLTPHGKSSRIFKSFWDWLSEKLINLNPKAYEYPYKKKGFAMGIRVVGESIERVVVERGEYYVDGLVTRGSWT